MERAQSIADNVEQVKERVSRAARRSGRNAADVRIMAASKTFGAEEIRAAYEAGITLFGENRVQEYADKVEDSQALQRAEWHLIGHLQSNKAARAVELFDAVDSLDSFKLARRLDRGAALYGKVLPVLLEVNVGGENAKSGVAPVSLELEEILRGIATLEHLELRGLMAVPPFNEDPEATRASFRSLRLLRDEIRARALPRVSMDVLSMGMSHDFEVAIEEGSTCVRLGTAIFGKRVKVEAAETRQ